MKNRPYQSFNHVGLRFNLFILLILAIAGESIESKAAPATIPPCQTFAETGFEVCGRFLEYWQSNGGLAQQGLPISSVFEERNADPPSGDGKIHKVQYFERARFEEHLENKAPYDVLLGLLGSEQFKTKYPNGTPANNTLLSKVCRDFTETGFKVCGRFLEYWQANGRLTQQGLPISPVFEERNAPPPNGDGKVHRVQYFERARFEEHLENKAPYDVLLGLLGREQSATKPGIPKNPPADSEAYLVLEKSFKAPFTSVKMDIDAGGGGVDFNYKVVLINGVRPEDSRIKADYTFFGLSFTIVVIGLNAYFSVDDGTTWYKICDPAVKQRLQEIFDQIRNTNPAEILKSVDRNSVRLLSDTTFNGKTVGVLQYTAQVEGSPANYLTYYDKKTYLPVRTQVKGRAQNYDIEGTAVFSDYDSPTNRVDEPKPLGCA